MGSYFRNGMLPQTGLFLAAQALLQIHHLVLVLDVRHLAAKRGPS